MKQTMKDLPSQERPYEKCIRKGEAALSDSELLSVILRCGTKGRSSLALANEILNCMQESSYPGLPGILPQFSCRPGKNPWDRNCEGCTVKVYWRAF